MSDNIASSTDAGKNNEDLTKVSFKKRLSTSTIHQFMTISMDGLPDCIIGFIASFLFLKDRIQFSLCNKITFNVCNEANTFSFVNLKDDIRFPINDIHKYKNVNEIKLKCSQITNLYNVKHNKLPLKINKLYLHDAMNKIVDIYHLSKQRIIDLNNIHTLDLSFSPTDFQIDYQIPSFTDPTLDYKRLPFATFVEIWNLLPHLQKLYVNGDMGWQKAGVLDERKLTTLSVRANIFFVSRLLEVTMNSLQNLTFEGTNRYFSLFLPFGSGPTVRLDPKPKYIYKELQKINVLNVTSQIAKDIISSAPNLTEINFTIDPDICSRNLVEVWKYNMQKMVSLSNIKRIEIICHWFEYNPVLATGIIHGLYARNESSTTSNETDRLEICIEFSQKCKQNRCRVQDLNLKCIFELIKCIKKRFWSPELAISVKYDCYNLEEEEVNQMAAKYNYLQENDAKCKICNSSNDFNEILYRCNACTGSYHPHCLESPCNIEYYKSVVWYCPSCAHHFERIPLKFKIDGQKWPHKKEPLAKNLESFLDMCPYLERNFNPDAHESLFSMQKIQITAGTVYNRKEFDPRDECLNDSQTTDHYWSLKWGQMFD